MGQNLSTTKGLNPMQRRFVEEYLSHPIGERNATRAAIDAGYSAKTAKAQGSKLLTKAAIRALVLKDQPKRRMQETRINDAWVLNEAAKLWDTPLTALFNEDGTLKAIHELSDDAQKMIAGIEVSQVGDEVRVSKVKLVDRLRVLDMIGKNVRVNAFGTKQIADAAGSFADLLRAMTTAVQRGDGIDARLVEQLTEGGE